MYQIIGGCLSLAIIFEGLKYLLNQPGLKKRKSMLALNTLRIAQRSYALDSPLIARSSPYDYSYPQLFLAVSYYFLNLRKFSNLCLNFLTTRGRLVKQTVAQSKILAVV